VTTNDTLIRAAVELWNEYGDPNDILSKVQVDALNAATAEVEEEDA